MGADFDKKRQNKKRKVLENIFLLGKGGFTMASLDIRGLVMSFLGSTKVLNSAILRPPKILSRKSTVIFANLWTRKSWTTISIRKGPTTPVGSALYVTRLIGG